MQQPMTTLTEVLNNLKEKGVTAEIRLNDANKIINTEMNTEVKANNLLIIKTYRFEGNSDPADNSALYLTKDNEENYAFIIDAYGAYSDFDTPVFESFLKEIKVDESKYDL